MPLHLLSAFFIDLPFGNQKYLSLTFHENQSNFLIITFCGEPVPAGQNVGRSIELSRIPPCR